MATKLTDQERQAILDDITAGTARNEIARKHKRSPGTISNIARDAGLEGVAFDRTATARASAAKQADNRARRAELSALLLEDSFKLRDRMWAPGETVVPSGQIVVTTLPVARDVRDFSASVQANVKSHLEIEKHDDGDQGAVDAKSMLLGVAEGLRAFAAEKLMVPAEDEAAEESG